MRTITGTPCKKPKQAKPVKTGTSMVWPVQTYTATPVRLTPSAQLWTANGGAVELCKEIEWEVFDHDAALDACGRADEAAGAVPWQQGRLP
jgi:hypothetical protein